MMVVVVVEGENVIRHVKREWELSRRDLSSWECVRGNVEGGNFRIHSYQFKHDVMDEAKRCIGSL